MYSPQEETAILHGIHDIMKELEYVPAEDLAYFMVKYDPDLASKLASQLDFALFDNDLKEKQNAGL